MSNAISLLYAKGTAQRAASVGDFQVKLQNMFYLKERFITRLILSALGTFIISGYLSCEEFQ